MGNCVCRRKAATWADDEQEDEHWIKKEEGGEAAATGQRDESCSASSSTTEVRIRISKKQLEELLRRAEGKGLPARDVMKDLIDMSMADDDSDSHWRPMLKSIAEEPDN